MGEPIDDETSRLRVPGGWIVRTKIWNYPGGTHIHQVYVPDAIHAWELK